MIRRGSRVTIRRLNSADLEQMANWRPFDDPLYADANWPQHRADDLDRWYARHIRDRRRLLFAVVDRKGRVIGSITLREIVGRSSARLGVTFGADYVDRGYGTEALALFLDHYFEELGFQKIVLDVVGYNRRAVRVYEKLGFVCVEEKERSLGWGKPMAFLDKPRYAEARRFFRRDWFGRYRVVYYEMELSREIWQERREDEHEFRSEPV